MPARPRIAPRDGLSHVIGGDSPPLVDLTVPQFLAAAVACHGDREAAVFRAAGERWTYDQLRRRADRLAAGLLGLGLYKGDRVGIWAPNRPEWLIAQFATARIGLILVNINPAYRRHELEYALNKVGAKALIAARQFKSSDYLGMLRDLAPELDTASPGRLRAKRLPELSTVIQLGDDSVAGTFSFAEVMGRGGGANRARLDAISCSLRPNDAINVQFTSGTTGAAKGATLTHRNIVNNGWFVGECMKFTEADVLCIPVPLYHCFGMVLSVLACVSHGACMVFPGEGFDPVEVLSAVEAERCTALHGVPTMFIAELDHRELKRFDLSSLRTGIMAGAP
ncbi:MAG TPA: AMP-binding protein, partial [Hyphomicrobiales bacterium]|nr:AMP-binding protein [Hyphomicrobiales bacterium]